MNRANTSIIKLQCLAAVSLTYGITIAQIAERLDVSVDTVETRMAQLRSSGYVEIAYYGNVSSAGGARTYHHAITSSGREFLEREAGIMRDALTSDPAYEAAP